MKKIPKINKQEGRKRIDYRAFANKHFKDPTKHLPLVLGTGHNSPKYVPPVIKKETKHKLYRIEFECNCGHSDIYRGGTEKIIKYIRKQSIPSCLRCSNYMYVKGIKENIFIVLFLRLKCLLKMLKKS